MVIELACRCGVDSAATRSPPSASLTQQLRERFLRSVRVECLDHIIILGETSLASILRRYCRYFDGARPHQGIRQQLPDALATNADSDRPIVAIPVLGGLHLE